MGRGTGGLKANFIHQHHTLLPAPLAYPNLQLGRRLHLHETLGGGLTRPPRGDRAPQGLPDERPPQGCGLVLLHPLGIGNDQNCYANGDSLCISGGFQWNFPWQAHWGSGQVKWPDMQCLAQRLAMIRFDPATIQMAGYSNRT